MFTVHYRNIVMAGLLGVGPLASAANAHDIWMVASPTEGFELFLQAIDLSSRGVVTLLCTPRN